MLLGNRLGKVEDDLTYLVAIFAGRPEQDRSCDSAPPHWRAARWNLHVAMRVDEWKPGGRHVTQHLVPRLRTILADEPGTHRGLFGDIIDADDVRGLVRALV